MATDKLPWNSCFSRVQDNLQLVQAQRWFPEGLDTRSQVKTLDSRGPHALAAFNLLEAMKTRLSNAHIVRSRPWMVDLLAMAKQEYNSRPLLKILSNFWLTEGPWVVCLKILQSPKRMCVLSLAQKQAIAPTLVIM